MLLSIPLDRTLAKKKFSWEFAVHIDDNDPLWHKAIDGKEANIEGGVKEISDHYRNFCSRYSPWGCAQDSSENGLENGRMICGKPWTNTVSEGRTVV